MARLPADNESFFHPRFSSSFPPVSVQILTLYSRVAHPRELIMLKLLLIELAALWLLQPAPPGAQGSNPLQISCRLTSRIGFVWDGQFRNRQLSPADNDRQLPHQRHDHGAPHTSGALCSILGGQPP
jgi:hypothetical protein